MVDICRRGTARLRTTAAAGTRNSYVDPTSQRDRRERSVNNVKAKTPHNHIGRAGRKTLGVGLAGLAVIGAACGSSSTPTSSSASTTGGSAPAKLTTVKISQYAGTENSWLTWIAAKQGFYQRNGINPQLVSVSTGAQDAPALETHAVDIVNMDLLLAAPTLLSKGVNLTLLTGAFLNPWSVIARKGIVPSSVAAQGFPASIKALAGKTVSIVAQGSASSFLVSALEKAVGMSSSSITQVPLGLPSAAIAALDANRVDAVMEIPPADFQAKLSGATTLFSFRSPSSKVSSANPLLGSVLGTTDGSMWALRSWASSHPAVVAEFRKAMVEASAWMHNPANFAQVVSTLNEKGMGLPYSGQQADAYVHAELSDIVSYYSASSAQAWTSFAEHFGILTKTIPYTNWWSSSVPQT